MQVRRREKRGWQLDRRRRQREEVEVGEEGSAVARGEEAEVEVEATEAGEGGDLFEDYEEIVKTRTASSHQIQKSQTRQAYQRKQSYSNCTLIVQKIQIASPSLIINLPCSIKHPKR
jgi:hypothetical protein